MELINRTDVIKAIQKQIEIYKDEEDVIQVLGNVLSVVLDLQSLDSNSSTPQSVVNFFIDEEQAKKYINEIIKTDADNQIKFVNYYG